MAGLPELGVAIFAVIVLNAVFAFAQQARADRAAERLRAMLPTRVSVRRDGRRQIVEAEDVVVDDVLLLESGDRIPADATVVAANRLLVDTSMLTGESAAVAVGTDEMLYAGTFVVEGEARAVVVAIGDRTRLAGIARLTTASAEAGHPAGAAGWRRWCASSRPSPSALAACSSSSRCSSATRCEDGFVFAIGVTVALVPEALLPTVTLSLAWGAEQMAKRQILVRNLEAVETLGSTTFICTDKTGTLTRNQMAVVEAWTPAGDVSVAGDGLRAGGGPRRGRYRARRRACAALALAAVRCSTGYTVQVDGRSGVSTATRWRRPSTRFARRLGIDTDADRRQHPASLRFPFDPRRRRMSVVVDGTVVVKGAPDAVLPAVRRRSRLRTPRSTRSPPGASECWPWPAAAARRCGPARPLGRPSGTWTCSGWSPSRTRRARTSARRWPPAAGRGISVAMVTGDHPATAAAIADQVGLRRSGDPVLTGAELPADDRILGRAPRPRRRGRRPGVARGQAAHRPGPALARPRRGDDRRRRQRRARPARGRHRRGHGPLRHRRGPRGRRPRPARRRLRHHRGRRRAGPGDVREHPPVPDLPPHRQRRRAHAVRRVGAVRRPVPAGPRRPADPRPRHRHRHALRAGARRRTAGAAPARRAARRRPADERHGRCGGPSASSDRSSRRCRCWPSWCRWPPRAGRPGSRSRPATTCWRHPAPRS